MKLPADFYTASLHLVCMPQCDASQRQDSKFFRIPPAALDTFCTQCKKLSRENKDTGLTHIIFTCNVQKEYQIP